MYDKKDIKYKKITHKRKKFITYKPNLKKKLKDKNDTFYNINWLDILKRLGILVIIVLLILFIMTRIKKHANKETTEFTENIEKVEKAAITYYQNNTLPINIGDSSSFIIKEIIDSNLITDLKENNLYCDYIDSYTILTKIEKEKYHLKIYLKCPKTQKTTEKTYKLSENRLEIEK